MDDFVVYVDKEMLIEMILLVVDILIIDYLFILFEFVLLEKLMIFFMYDLEEYDKVRGLLDGFLVMILGLFVYIIEELI